MQIIGSVKEIWHYPVKSMGGQSLPSTYVSRTGLLGDRLWAVVDALDHEIKSARQWPKMIELRADYSDGRPTAGALFGDAVPPVTIVGEGGFHVASSDEDTNAKLSAYLGKPCRLEPLLPPTAREHYRLARSRDMEEVFQEIDLLPDEAVPDFSGTPEAMYRLLEQYVTPPGTYFDSFPLHVVSANILNFLAVQAEVDTSTARFRPNLVLDLDRGLGETPEMEWTGKRLRVGSVDILLEAKTMRCSIPSRAQPMLGVERATALTRAMVDVLQRHLGMYASVMHPGPVAIGDPIALIDEDETGSG